MKSVILLALLALSASTFNLTAFGIGEAQQYGLTPEEIQQNGVPCFNALSTDFTNIIQLLETKNPVAILSGASALYTQLQTDAQTTCYAYMINVAGYISSQVNSTTDIFTVMKQNFELYYAQIIQQVAVEINDLIAGNPEAAGAAKGLATQIVLGIVTPQTLPVPSFNYSQYVPFNQEEFTTEYFTGFFGAIGLNQTFDDSEVNSCITSLITWGQAMDVLIGNFSGYSFADKVQGISSFMEVTGESIESCEYYWQLSASLFAPLKESFEASPISFVLQVVNNVAMNFPELVQSAEIEEINILEGEYEAAGQLKGERFAQIFGFAL